MSLRSAALARLALLLAVLPLAGCFEDPQREEKLKWREEEVNAKEAASPHLFVAGWRPAVGWCCAAGFLWATIGQPVAGWVAAAQGWPAPPTIDTDILMYVLGGLLGLGTLRTFEKTKGAAK